MQATHLSRKQYFNIGFLAGLVAGIVAGLVMLLLSITVGGISLPEVLGSAITALMPPSAFQYLHELIGGDAKYYLFYIILVGQCLVFALGGGLYNIIVRSSPLKQRNDLHSWRDGLFLVLALWLLTGLVLLPLTGAGLFGAALTFGVGNTMFRLAVIGLVFGFVFVPVQNWLVIRHQQAEQAMGEDGMEEREQARRTLLLRGAGLIGLSVFGVLAWRFITKGGTTSSSISVPQLIQNYKNKVVPPPIPNYGTIQPVPYLTAEITPNDQYYIVSKNLIADPTVNASTWHLTVDGLVAHPYMMTYNELLTLPIKQQYESMMCISNDVGGDYMSNARWEGIPLVTVLARAGAIKPGASKVVLYAADDYSDSIHLSKALESTTLLAVRMNGETLPQGHGFPVRLLVPGIYGMKHVKWITRIEVVNTDYQGYWQQRGWSDPAPIRMNSRIDTPLAGSKLTANQPTYIAGVAFSGNKGISEVDVSLDEGHTWQRATLKRPLSALTWVLWELPWQPKAGSYTIVVRAIDLQGNVQDSHVQPPAPDGSSGYHTINVTVS